MLLLVLSIAGTAAAAVPILIAPEAAPLEEFAARELAEHLERLYPGERFPVVTSDPGETNHIVLGTSAKFSEYLDKPGPAGPDSFVVTTTRDGGATIGVIAGGDSRGVLFGAYALLEELGYGFYLSYTGAPAARSEFTFDKWDLADEPLFGERLVFDWHNFLSSASTWELTDWQSYIDQAARMRFSGILVHAYGNNPMYSFSHNGITKPVGYLSTTRSGRDWGTQHVNDVRRLVGASGIFTEAEFGSSAARVAEGDRAEAATALMQKVFAYAESRGMDVSLALDVDTVSANPQEIIRTLPGPAKFRSGEVELPNPDTPEGAAYFESLVTQTLETYPEIDQLVVWFRRARTPWLELKPSDFPEPWQAAYRDALARRPDLADDPYAPRMFAIGRIVRAFEKILSSAGRDDVKLATGTWQFAHVRAAHAFFPPKAKLMALDWNVQFETTEIQDIIKAVSDERDFVPVVWAHHDDHTYIGRPYTPYPEFASLLKSGNNKGYAIIHWTTRPLDLYFKSTVRQTWRASADEPLEKTFLRTAVRTFGPELAEEGAAYLGRWIREAPMFGRETTDRFIDRPLGSPDEVIGLSHARRELLKLMDEAQLSNTGLDSRNYFLDYETFIEEFFRAHNHLERSRAALTAGDLEAARKEIQLASPEKAIERYAIASGRGSISKGEEAILISLNLRWLPYFRAQKQVLGLEPVRINFQPTQHDPLAQGAGHFTYFFEKGGDIWNSLGTEETGLPTFTGHHMQSAPDGLDPDLLASGVVIQEPAELNLTALTNAPLQPDAYEVELLFVDDTPSPAQVIRFKQRITVADGDSRVRLAPHGAYNRLAALTVTPARP